MEITYITESDLKEFSVLYRDYFNEEGDNWSYDRAYKRLHQMQSIDDSICLKAVKDNKICGIIMGYLDWFDDSAIFHIFEVLILKEYQNSGTGSKLIAAAEKLAIEKGAKSASLEALDDEQHEHFYGKLGYQTKEHLVYKMKRFN